jgi:hypothetical protein
VSNETLEPIAYQGFMNMVHRIWGGSMDPSPLAEKHLASVAVSEDKEQLVFTLDDGRTLTYHTEADCCSSSWIEHLTVPADISGAEVTGWAEQDIGQTEQDYKTIKVYQTSFRTDKGEIIVEYRNSSNGYYGGWLDGPDESWAKDEINARREATR